MPYPAVIIKELPDCTSVAARTPPCRRLLVRKYAKPCLPGEPFSPFLRGARGFYFGISSSAKLDPHSDGKTLSRSHPQFRLRIRQACHNLRRRALQCFCGQAARAERVDGGEQRVGENPGSRRP